MAENREDKDVGVGERRMRRGAKIKKGALGGLCRVLDLASGVKLPALAVVRTC